MTDANHSQLTQVNLQVPTRVDFVGGTLDLDPIGHILGPVYTLNAAVSLYAHIEIAPLSSQEKKLYPLVIISKDLNITERFENIHFPIESIQSSLSFPLRIVQSFFHHHQNLNASIQITINMDTPKGSGLGASSTMGIGLGVALHQYFHLPVEKKALIDWIKNVEAIQLALGPTGYQDYYPAIHRGVLALTAGHFGVTAKPLENKQLLSQMNAHFQVISSQITRNSAINNWEVYQRFFNGDKTVRTGLAEIARVSKVAFQALWEKSNIPDFFRLVMEEGKIREQLFSDITPKEVSNFQRKLPSEVGIKMCGAGGGGCFMLVSPRPIVEIISPQQLHNWCKEASFIPLTSHIVT